jgi:hypothetical protein
MSDTKPTYGDGLVFVVDNDLVVEVWVDGAWLGDVKLQTLDQFLRLRKLTDTDNQVAFTRLEAKDYRESVA